MFSADYTEAVFGYLHRLQNGGKQELWLLWSTKVSTRSHVNPWLQLLAFMIFTAIRKHSAQPYLPRATHFGALKFLSITGGWCWVVYMPSCIFCNRNRGVSKFVNRKELHFTRKANWGSQCGILTDCFGSYCILLVFVNCSDLVPEGNISLLIDLYFPPN